MTRHSGTSFLPLRTMLHSTVSFTVLVAMTTSLAIADPGAQAPAANVLAAPAMTAVGTSSGVDETNRYNVRLITQIFDGSQELSHTQVAAFARKRQGNTSWTMMDFGDGSVVITEPGNVAVSSFENTSPAEMGVLYDYETQTIEGDSDVAQFHNTFVRQQLGNAPALGSDARWTAQMPVAALGVEGLTGGNVKIDLSREYFTHDGKQMVLLKYRIPAFMSAAGSTKVMHWGEGFALTDPGFGNIYTSATLQRSVADEPNGVKRPYRYIRNFFASDETGAPMLDIREIPQVAEIYDDYFSVQAVDVIPFTADAGSADQRPVALAANLDVMAFSIAENGANDVGITSGGSTNGNRGSERPTGGGLGGTMSTVSTGTSLAGNTYTWANIAAGSPQEQSAFIAIKNNLAAYKARGQSLSTELNAKAARVEQLENQIKATRGGTWNASDSLNNAENIMTRAGQEFQTAANNLDDAFRRYAPGGSSTLSTAEKSAARQQAYNAYKAAQFRNQTAISTYEAALNNPANYTYVPNRVEAGLAEEFADAAYDFRIAEQKLAQYGQEGLAIAAEVKAIPASRMPTFSSVLGGGLAVLGNGMNGYTVGASLANFQNQAGTNLSSGAGPRLTRTYGGALNGTGLTGAGLFDLGLGLDLLGLAGAALSGDVVGAVTTVAAIGTGSITDILLSAKGLKDINTVNLEAAELGRKLARERREQYERVSDEREERFRAEIAQLDADIARLDELAPAAERNRDNIMRQRDEARAARQAAEAEAAAQAARQAAAEAQAARDRAARAERLRREQEWADGANDRLRDAMEPDYPTAPPRDPNAPPRPPREPAPPPPPTAEEIRQAEIDARQAKAKAELDAYQTKKLAEMKAERERNRNKETKPFTTSPLTVSQFDTDPVTFEPVTFTPVTFLKVEFDKDRDLFDEDGNLKKVGPDDFEMTPFDAPDISEFPPTDPDDKDGYPGTGLYPAFDYDGLEGTIETSLDRWAEWLETQNVAQLTRLALQAGYPNLASALADAENIMRFSQDTGYRRWALTAPSCAGSIGCGPSYLERWSMKSSIVALGDILVQSREIFSTGGFSDIGISGLQLIYILRDFGLQDGDLVDIQISQFGRTIFTNRLSLTNAGDDFAIRLRQGVAQLVITAVNEGSVSPNTAEIDIANVVRGEGNQTYSLNTGQTAVLRIEANATAASSSNSGIGN